MAQVLNISGDNLERDIGLVRQQAVQVAESASQITVTANEVAEGAETQLRVLEKTVAMLRGACMSPMTPWTNCAIVK